MNTLQKKTHELAFPDSKLIEETLAACHQDGKIFIPGEVPSKKNSKQIVHKGGRPILISSDFTKYYERNAMIFYNVMRSNWMAMIRDKEPPYSVEFTLARRTSQRFDYLNLGQIIQDMMVSGKWVEDDNSNFIIPLFGKAYKSELFGVWIRTV